MKKFIYDPKGQELIRIVEDDPECGKDFCELCGDCLACYGGDPCVPGDGNTYPNHMWVQYGEVDDDTV